MRRGSLRAQMQAVCAVVMVAVLEATVAEAQGTPPAKPAARRDAAPPKAQAAKPVIGGRPRTHPSTKLPWGDPDLQGNYSIISEANTPLERPDEFAGRRIEDFTPEEMARLSKERTARALSEYNGLPEPGWFDHVIPNLNSRPWLVFDPPDGRIPPLTAEGQVRPRVQEPTDPVSYADMPQFVRCITTGPPIAQAVPTIYGNSFQILQTKDYVVIRHEMIHERRLIPIEGRGASRGHNPPVLRSYFGDAVARWEGETLVVDSTNYRPELTFRESRGGRLHTIERFTRTGPKQVEWKITVDDPATWTRPWSFAIPMTEDNDQAIVEYTCHETNLALRNVLSGARNKEKAAAGKAR